MAAYRRYCEKQSIPHTVHLIDHAGHSYYSIEWTSELFASSRKFLREP
jgi:hypothetical protein